MKVDNEVYYAEEPLIKPKPRKKGVCKSFFRCLCCCCIKKGSKLSKAFWQDIFKSKTEFDPLYTTLLHLFSQQPAINELENCPASPLFTNPSRQDLEFYVPQLSNLLLFIYKEDLKGLLTAVLQKCQESFYFSHRIYWFLKSTDFMMLEDSHIDPELLLQSLVKVSSETSGLYVNHSGVIEKLMVKAGMEVRENGVFYNRLLDSTAAGIEEAVETYAATEENILTQPLHPKYLAYRFFGTEQIPNPYMSTLSFIEELTNISTIIMKASDKKGVLKKELARVNQMLPACVYIPFDKPESRESFVLHIPTEEVKVFTTKERAPYLICVEVFRPLEEFKLQAQKKSTKSRNETIEKLYSSFIVFPKTQSFLEKAVTETFVPETKYSRNQSMAIPSTRVTSIMQHDSLHYDAPRISEEKLQSIAPFYEANEESQSEDVIKSFQNQAERIRKNSPFGTLKTWALVHMIVKSGDDLRQEQLAMQLISLFLLIFQEKKLKLWLYAYDILATGADCGILECVPDAISLDALKKATQRKTLLEFFTQQFGGEDSREFKKARKEFMRSLAGYSLLCYFLQIKDRHNGNILLDRQGHLVHIDFGFILSNAPGRGLKFESAPFKLTNEFEELLGGRRSILFLKFRSLCYKGFIALKEKAEQIYYMTEMMRIGSGSNLGCFSGGEESTKGVKQRLLDTRGLSDREYINSLIDDSLDNWTTRCYDRFQYCCQNIFY